MLSITQKLFPTFQTYDETIKDFDKSQKAIIWPQPIVESEDDINVRNNENLFNLYVVDWQFPFIFS